MSLPNILLVEQDAMMAEMYAMQLMNTAQITVARDAQAALDYLDSASFDGIIVDALLGEHNGIEIIHEIKSYDDWFNIPIIVLSSVPLTHVSDRQWSRYGIYTVLYKPKLHAHQLVSAVQANMVAA